MFRLERVKIRNNVHQKALDSIKTFCFLCAFILENLRVGAEVGLLQEMFLLPERIERRDKQSTYLLLKDVIR